MRVLFAHNYYRLAGGEDAVVVQEMSLLRNAGHDVELYSLNNDDIKGLGGRVKAMLDVTYSDQERAKFLQVLVKVKPDIVHAHNLFPLLTPSIYDACNECGIPVVQTLHNYRLMCAGALLMRNGRVCEDCVKGSPYIGVLHRCYRNSFIGTLAVSNMISRHRREKTWSLKVDCMIALTEFSRSKFIEAGIDPARVIVKPNFTEDPVPGGEILKTATRFGVLYVGRLSEEKGIGNLLEAWNNLDIPLTIAGDGPCRSHVELLSGPHVRYLGAITRDEISREMRKARLLIMPSIWYEGFPMVLLEALAHGLPVLGSNIGNVGQIIDKHSSGRLFRRGDSDDLKKQVVGLYHDMDALQDYSDNGRRAYESEYTPSKNLQMLEKIYYDLIHKTE